MMIVRDRSQDDASLLLQHDRHPDVSLHVHVGGAAHRPGLQAQGDLRGVVAVDGEVL